MNGILMFFVAGRPQPEAKKKIRGGWDRPRMYSRDPDGTKRGWMENVRLCARKAMRKQKWTKIPAKVGVTVEYKFYFRQAKSNRDDEMVIKPDESRLIEAMDDALEGVCYENDMQINRHIVSKQYMDDVQVNEGVQVAVWRTR